MAPQHNPPIMIEPGQNRPMVARIAGMTATQKIPGLAAIQQYALGDVRQREALMELIEQMGYSIELPPRADCEKVVVFPLVVTGPNGEQVPVLLHDTEFLPAAVVAAVATGGLEAAHHLNYRVGMLPVAKR